MTTRSRTTAPAARSFRTNPPATTSCPTPSRLPSTPTRSPHARSCASRSARATGTRSPIPTPPTPRRPSTTSRSAIRALVHQLGWRRLDAGRQFRSSRWQYDGSYTYFKSSLVGAAHEFKMGGEFTREWYNKFQDARGPGTGGTGNDYELIYANAAVPFQVRLYNSPFLAKNNVNYQSAFFRDTVRVGDRLTFSTSASGSSAITRSSPEQSKVAGPFSPAASYAPVELYDWRGIVPRIGLSYALTADNKTVVKATYGRLRLRAARLRLPHHPQLQQERLLSGALPVERPERQQGARLSGRSSGASSRPKAPAAPSSTRTSPSRKPTKSRCISNVRSRPALPPASATSTSAKATSSSW